jgi:PDZ domain
LWSGDWRVDSAAAAEELARRRAEDQEPAETPEPESQQPTPSMAARVAEWLRATRESIARSAARWRDDHRGAGSGLSGAVRRHRTSLLAVLGTLLVAAVAYGAVSLVAGSGSGDSNSGGPPAYLGVDMANAPFSFQGSGSGFPFANGVMVLNVKPGSPAAAAGLEPGDVITNVDNQPVTTPAQVNAVVARLHAGDRVQIQYVQSFTTYTTQATLTRPPRSP